MEKSRDIWRVLKFGGGSTSSVPEWETLIEVIRSRLRDGIRPLAVFAALKGVTRQLNAMIEQAAAGRAIDDDLGQLRLDHLDRARSVGVDLDEQLFLDEIGQLRTRLEGVAAMKTVSPGAKAEILATGEYLATELAARIFEKRGLTTTVIDAKDLLRSVVIEKASNVRNYLRAECDPSPDPDLVDRLRETDADVVITQGFFASNEQGETVLLGWGGSDTSATCLAAKLGADKVELWKNVPGFFTADPRLAPSARLLRRLDYEEAFEIASAGAEVVHPGAIAPARDARISIEIRSMQESNDEHTVIGEQAVRGAQLKSIAARKGITLISIETPRMWQEVGFLARVFDALVLHDLSVDLVATSESNVTVSIDPFHNLGPPAIDQAIEALRSFCDARAIEPCAVISLIGRELRSILPDLSPALGVLDEQPIHLLSQSASDVDFSFVVDEQYADRIVQRLHATFFDHQPIDEIFGPSWSAITQKPPALSIDSWWRDRRNELLSIAGKTSPVYVYDEATLRRQVQRLVDLETIDRVFYATKANWHPDVLRTFNEAGIGFECVSPGEIAHLRAVLPDLDPTRILFTPNFAPRRDYEEAYEEGAWVTLDNVHPLEAWPELFRKRPVLLRIDPGRGHGHHRHVRTAGILSKFGIAPGELERVATLVRELDVEVVGLHAHVGSGVKTADAWSHTARTLESFTNLFDDVRVINVGGGLGVVERPGDPALDLEEMAESLGQALREHPELEIWLEPGRFLVSEAGVLLTTVTQLKEKGPVRYIGIDTGFNSLLRPALYGSHHEIVNLTRLDEDPDIVAEIVGPICETGDVLGHGRAMPPTREGDILLIATAGAYGRVMSSEYNRRAPAEERFLREKR